MGRQAAPESRLPCETKGLVVGAQNPQLELKRDERIDKGETE
jgi:hypothetical protein